MRIISTTGIKQSIERTNNALDSGNGLCYSASTNCTYSICISGVCESCPYDPLKCCFSSLGTCFSADGVAYGLCAPACNCHG